MHIILEPSVFNSILWNDSTDYELFQGTKVGRQDTRVTSETIEILHLLLPWNRACFGIWSFIRLLHGLC